MQVRDQNLICHCRPGRVSMLQKPHSRILHTSITMSIQVLLAHKCVSSNQTEARPVVHALATTPPDRRAGS